ncbi:MAG: bacterio-opsin activator domain-containing protein [Halovenus sp.]
MRILLTDAGTGVDETRAALEEPGWQVTVADSLGEAHTQLRNGRVDLVVSEYSLPDGDGLEFLRSVRSRYERLPFVLFTGHGSERVASEAIDADVSAYIPKAEPDAHEQLAAAVDELAVREVSGYRDIPTPTVETIIRAIDEAPVGITISDPVLPDNPLVYLNEAYEDITGYEREDVLGRNCRFLQGPETSEEPVRKMREAVDNREPVSVELLNYREDGSPFWNKVDIAPLFDDQGELAHFVGFQSDITERKEAEATAQRRADALREERQALERVLGRVSGLLNDTSEVLVGSTDRDELEKRVCSLITDTDGYRHAWVGEMPAAGSTVRVRVTADGEEQIGSTATEHTETAPQQALRRGSVVTTSSAAEMPPSMSPGEFGAETVAAIPLIYRRSSYGVLCVYAETSELLDRRECAVFEALGRMIASGINAVETKQILTSDRLTELGFEIADRSFPLSVLAHKAEGSISYDGSTMSETDSLRLFLTVEDTNGALESVLEDCDGISEGFVIARQSGVAAVSIELADPSPFLELAEYGATIRDLSVSGQTGTAKLRVDLPPEGEVRSVLEVLEDAYDGVELVRQRERQRAPRPTAEFTAAVADRLTDRQYTALETAYLSDYFEFPRPVSGEELAESMDISRQTYHQHLRSAQRKLLDEFFDPE